MRKSVIAFVVFLFMLFSTSVVFADKNPDVTIVNPVSATTLYSDNLLISVKLTQPTTIKVNVYQEFKVVNGTNTAITLEEYQKARSSAETDKVEVKSVLFSTTEQPFTTTNNLSYYTKKLENVTPGIYRIKISTLDAEGKEIFTNTSYVVIKAKAETSEDAVVFDSQQSGTAQFLKGLLKTIFGN